MVEKEKNVANFAHSQFRSFAFYTASVRRASDVAASWPVFHHHPHHQHQQQLFICEAMD